MQIIPIYYHQNGRRTNFRGTAHRKLASKKGHCIGFTTSGCSKVGTALSTFLLNGFHDTFTKESCCEKLRITAHNFFFLIIKLLILEINVITKYFKETFRFIYSLNHCSHLIKWRCRNFITIIYPSPSIKMLVRCTHSTQACFHPIAYTSQRTIMQQMGNITPIA